MYTSFQRETYRLQDIHLKAFLPSGLLLCCHQLISGNLTGNISIAGKGFTKFELLPKTTLITKGDIIVTAGTSGYYPPNLVIGTVEEIKLEESGITAFATIRPASDIYEIKHVFVLTDFLGKQTASPDAESEGN